MGDVRVYRPAALLRLQIRLEDFSEAGDPPVPTEGEPFPGLVKQLTAAEANLTQALAQARARASRANASAVSDLTRRLAGVRAQLDQIKSSQPNARVIQEALGDVFSVNFLAVPTEVSVELNSWRIADTCTATLAYKDAPLVSQVIRSALLEVYLGTVPVADFGTPDRWRLTLDRTNLMFRGYIDEWRTSHSGDDATVTLEARSMEAILMDTKIHPLSPIFRPRGEAEPITKYINRVLASIPATGDQKGGTQLKALMYRAQSEPALSRKLLSRQLQTAESRNQADGQVATAPVDVGGTDPGQVEGAGTPRLTPDQAPEDISAWDLITKACILVGVVPTYDPALATSSPEFTGPGGQQRPTETIGDFLLLRPPQTLFDKVGGGVKIEGGAQDGFSRQLPDPQSPIHALDTQDIRFMVWGRNIKEFSTGRKLGRIKAPAVEVVSYNPDAPPHLRNLRARFPKTHRGTRIGATGSGKVDEVVTRIVRPPIRDLAQLEQIAVALHHAIARQELTVTIETDDLSSYIDPTRPETHNENPDLLKLRHGTPVRVVVAKQVSNPVQGNSLVLTPLSEVFERRTDELRRFLLEQNQRYRPDLDPDISRILVDTMVQRISTALQSARQVDLFYTRAIQHRWNSAEGWDAKIELVNYMEARSLPAALSVDDQKADAVMRLPAGGIPPSATTTARTRARRSQGLK